MFVYVLVCNTCKELKPFDKFSKRMEQREHTLIGVRFATTIMSKMFGIRIMVNHKELLQRNIKQIIDSKCCLKNTIRQRLLSKSFLKIQTTLVRFVVQVITYVLTIATLLEMLEVSFANPVIQVWVC